VTRSTALALACCLALAGCGGGDRGLARDIRGAVADAGQDGTLLDLGAVVDGDWDRLTFVCPYEGEEVVTDRLGSAWEDFPGEDLSEARALYVFSTADDVVTWAEVDRGDGDPCGTDQELPMSVARADAVFAVEQSGGSAPHHDLRLPG
jgi:hypothetical protein